MGLLLFARAIHPIIIEVKSTIRQVYHEEDLIGYPTLLAFYLDDRVVVAHHVTLTAVTRFLVYPKAQSFVLHLKIDRTKTVAAVHP